MALSASSRRSLVALGRASRPAHTSTFSPFALAVAVALLIVATVSLVAIGASYAGVTQRDTARSPVLLEDSQMSPGSTAFLYRDVHDSLISIGEDATIVYLVPQSPNAPLPPGVTEWPKPGQVVISPALTSLTDEGIETRYGTVVGTIGSEGLATPTEKIAYVHPAPNIVDATLMLRATGFGAHVEGGMFGDAVDRQPAWRFFAAFMSTVGLVTGVVASFAARSNLDQRRRDNTALLTLGMTRGERVAWQWGMIKRPILLGTMIGLAITIIPFVFDLHLPFRSFVLQARDLREYLIPALALIAAVVVIYTAVTISLAVVYPRRFAANRPVADVSPYSKRKAVACFVSTPVAVVAMLLLNLSGSVVLFFLYVAALGTVIVALPDLLALLIDRWASTIRRSGREQNSPARIVGAASLQSGGTASLKLAYLMCVVIIIAAQVLLLLIARAHSNYEALAQHEHFDNSVVEILPMPGASASFTESVFTSLSLPATRLFMFRSAYSEDEQSVQVAGIGHELNQDELTIGKLSDYIRTKTDTSTGTGITVVSAPSLLSLQHAEEGNLDATYWYAVISEDSTLSLSTIKELVASRVAPMWRTDVPGTNAYVGTQLGVSQASWIGWLGVCALSIATIGAVIILLEDATTISRALAPLTVLMRANKTLYRAMSLLFLAPVSLGLGVGILLALMLGSALTMSVGGTVTFMLPFAVATVCAGGLITLIGYLLALYASRRALVRWKVGNNDS